MLIESEFDQIKVGLVDSLASLLKCMKYFGLPLGVSFKAKSFLDGVIEKIERILARWKGMYLFEVGIITLIKSTLSNLPTHFVFVFTSLPM